MAGTLRQAIARRNTEAVANGTSVNPNHVEAVFKKARRRAQVDPVWFARHILQLKALPGEATLDEEPHASWEMDAWQVELLDAFGDAVRKKRGLPTKVNHDGKGYVTTRSMHGPGKTFGAATIAHWFGFAFDQPLLVATAPKMTQIRRQLFAEFERIRRRAVPGYAALMEVGASAVTWAEDPTWVMVAETASSPENMQGKHRPNTLVIVDEASGVPEELFPVIYGALSTGDNLFLLLVGNPTKTLGTFADSHLRAGVRDQFHQIHISLDKTKRVKRDWVERMEQQYGKNSPVVKVRCYGEFAETDENQLIALQWISDAFNREMKPDGSHPRIRISIDVADGGENESVITICRHYQSFVQGLKQFAYSFPQARAPIMCADEAVRLWEAMGCNTKNGDDIVVDSIGVGAGTAGSLMQRDFPCIPYRGGAPSDNPSMWRNKRVQSFLVLRNMLRDGKLCFNDDFFQYPQDADVFQAQLCSIRSKPGIERMEDIVTKQEMIRQGIASPDRADSLAMQYATQAPSFVDSMPGERMIVVASDLWSAF